MSVAPASPSSSEPLKDTRLSHPSPGKAARRFRGQAVDLPGEVHVTEQVFHKGLELGPLAGGHRGEHRRGRRHALRELGQQLVEVLRLAREKVAETFHELFEARIERLAGRALLDHLVERVESIADVLTLAGAGGGHGARHLVEVGLHDLLAQPLQQLLEALSRLARGELVATQFSYAAGEVLWEQREFRAALGHDLLGHLPAPFVPGVAGFAFELVERPTLLADDLIQLVGYLAVGTSEIVLLALLAAARLRSAPAVPAAPRCGGRCGPRIPPAACGAGRGRHPRGT